MAAIQKSATGTSMAAPVNMEFECHRYDYIKCNNYLVYYLFHLIIIGRMSMIMIILLYLFNQPPVNCRQCPRSRGFRHRPLGLRCWFL